MSGLRRVVLAAENASTRLGGEAILPYHYFRLLLARDVDVHLVVHARMQAELLELFPEDADRLRFVPDQFLQKLFYRLGRVLPRRVDEATLGLLNQFLTQVAQRKVIRSLVVPGSVVHQPIPVSPRFPSLMYGLGAPVVIGPLNGGMEYPAAFRGEEAGWNRVLIALGRRFTDVANRLLPGKLNAAVVLAANQRTAEALPSGMRGRVMLLPENGVDAGAWTGTAGQQAANRFVFVGRLVDWKALDVVLEALVQVPGAVLQVIGEGAMRGGWEAVAERLGVADRVRWMGWLSQTACAQELAGCCALVLPSVYECGGAVVLEAMAMSRPVIATAWGGPLDYLDASCGVLIEPVSRQALVDGFARAMQGLMDAPDEAAALGMAGRARVLEDFEWGRKIDAILGVYGAALVEPGR